MISNIVNISVVVISLVTASGIFLHDTRVDRAATTAITLPAEIVADTASNDKLMNWDAHTHVERMTFSQTVRDLQSSNPRIQPRNDDKKHVLQNRVARGHHPFDSYNLPLV